MNTIISLTPEEVIYLGYILHEALEQTTRAESIQVITKLLEEVTEQL